MRRLVGLAIVIAAAAAVGPGLGLGCSHGAKPAVQPEDHPVLPPASGTPIGYLVDDAGELKLTDDQLARLKAIDQDLAARLEVLDGKVRASSQVFAPPPEETGDKGRGLGFRAGGARVDGSAPGMGARMTTWGDGGSGSAAQQAPIGGNPDAAGRLAEERADDVREAIARALAELDVVQRVIAKRVLADHGIDADTGRGQAAPAEAGVPGEPSSGSGPGSN